MYTLEQIERAIEEVTLCLADDEDGQGYLWDYLKFGGDDIVLKALYLYKQNVEKKP